MLLSAEQKAKRGPCSCSSGFVELHGPLPAHVDPEAFSDACDVVELSERVARSERALLPTEWLEQPAKWLAAYEFLKPFLAEDVTRERERLRKDTRSGN